MNVDTEVIEQLLEEEGTNDDGNRILENDDMQNSNAKRAKRTV